jgi:hypothetical protein
VTSALHISDAEIRFIGGRMVPLAKIDGRWHIIDTKPSLIHVGVAVAIPVDEDGREDWDCQPRLRAVVAPDPANGRPVSLALEDATDDPTVVALAQRFVDLAVRGEARPGRFYHLEG